MGKKRKFLQCPFMTGIVPVECDGDKCELWLKAEYVGGIMVRGGCAVYWQGIKARYDVAKVLGVAVEVQDV